MNINNSQFLGILSGGLGIETLGKPFAVECESDESMANEDFELITDFIADLLLRNHLEEMKDREVGYA